MKTKLPIFAAIILTTLWVTCGSVALAQRPGSSDKSKTEKSDSKKSDTKKSNSKKSDSKKKAPKPITAIVGGDVHTVTGSVIRGGTILIQDGKILDVGQSITVPDDATVIDAKGKVITPGFVAINMSRIGVRTTPSGRDKLADALDPFDRNMKYALGVGITTGCIELSPSRRRSRFGAENSDQTGPQGDESPDPAPNADDAVSTDTSDEEDLNITSAADAIAAGLKEDIGGPIERFPGIDAEPRQFVTEALLDYGEKNTGLCPCCGLPVLPTEPITPAQPRAPRPRKHSVIKLSFGHLDSMMLKENVFYTPNFGALSGALNRHNWRRNIKKAKEAIEAEKKKSTSTATAKSTSKSSSTSTKTSKTSSSTSRTRRSRANPDLIRLLKREVALRVRADSVDDIQNMANMAQQLGYDLIIEGGTEAWLVPEVVSAADAQVIYTPRRRRQATRGNEDRSGSNFESPGIFEESGIPFATSALSSSISMGGLAGRDLSSLPLEAAFAVRGGASERKALESITITPARMLGLGDRIGSIEVGKDADLLILNGTPLDYRTYVEQAIVSGDVCYDRSEDKVYPVFDRQ